MVLPWCIKLGHRQRAIAPLAEQTSGVVHHQQVRASDCVGAGWSEQEGDLAVYGKAVGRVHGVEIDKLKHLAPHRTFAVGLTERRGTRVKQRNGLQSTNQ